MSWRGYWYMMTPSGHIVPGMRATDPITVWINFTIAVKQTRRELETRGYRAKQFKRKNYGSQND